jgi:putative transposase
LLGIYKKPFKKDMKKTGLVATMPNEYFHVDSTYYPLIDGKKICISFVMDNYSKMILGFHVAEDLSFEVVKTAFANAMKIVETHPHVRDSTLVADGGRENHHKKINEFIANITGRRITKITALKDILFSNSPVEAIHKIMKSRYLRRHKFASVKAVIKYLDWAVMDYNTLRPHCRHRPRTPNEVYFDIPLDFDIRTRMKESMRKRVVHNKNVKCLSCKTFKEQSNCKKTSELS